MVLTENFRSRQEILDAAYRLIQHNNPNRLETIEKIDKHLYAAISQGVTTPAGALPSEENSVVNPVTYLQFDTLSAEADKVGRLRRGDELPPGVIKLVKVYLSLIHI